MWYMKKTSWVEHDTWRVFLAPSTDDSYALSSTKGKVARIPVALVTWVFNPAGHEISTLRWQKLRRRRRNFKFSLKYIKSDQTLPNLEKNFIKHLFSLPSNFNQTKFSFVSELSDTVFAIKSFLLTNFYVKTY